MPLLRHLHLPSLHPHYVPYSLASRVQEHLRRQHLDFKDQHQHQQPQHQPQPQPPLPTLLSFTPSPIYTLGRRQTTPPTAAQLARLTAPLQISPPYKSTSSNSNSSPNKINNELLSTTPKVLASPRGGLTTYHGPGQLVLWPVLDLRSPHHRHFTVKCYARLLETTTGGVLEGVFGLSGVTTDDPGVWVVRRRNSLPSLVSSLSSSPLSPPPPSPKTEEATQTQAQQEEKQEGGQDLAKIAALGVHLRRYTTALGTALNLAMPHPSVTSEALNPWARFVPCGLEGKGVTSVAGEVGEEEMERLLDGRRSTVGEGREEVVAREWAGELAGRVGLDGVEVVERGEVVGLVEGLVREEGGEEEERVYLEWLREVR